MTNYESQLKERKAELKQLKSNQENIEDDRTAQRVQMLLEKMARTIDRTNYKVYREEVETLIDADKTVHRS